MFGFYVWHPILTLAPDGSENHVFMAVYSEDGSLSKVTFYVDGKPVWATLYPDVADQSFHMALCSNKASGENIDTSQNSLQITEASLATL